MTLRTRLFVAIGLASLVASGPLACSDPSPSPPNTSGDETGPAAETAPPLPAIAAGGLTAFRSYCTGTLKVAKPLDRARSTAFWEETSSMAPIGTEFLIAGIGAKEGLVVLEDGSFAKVGASVRNWLEETDYTTACKDLWSSKTVTLKTATIYPNADFTGSPCILPAVTEFTGNYGLQLPEVEGDLIASRCGFAKGYSKDLVIEFLYPR